MVDFAVVTGVGDQVRERLGLIGVQHSPAELLAVPAGALINQNRDEQMAQDVAYGRELREVLHAPAATLAVVMPYVVGLETRRVDGHQLTARGQEAPLPGQIQRAVMKLLKAPFLRRRRRA